MKAVTFLSSSVILVGLFSILPGCRAARSFGEPGESGEHELSSLGGESNAETGGSSTGGRTGVTTPQGGQGGSIVVPEEPEEPEEPTCDEGAPFPTLQLRGDGTFRDSVSKKLATVIGDVDASEGKFDTGFGFVPAAGGSYLTAPAGEGIEIGTSDFSLSFWVKTKKAFTIFDKRKSGVGFTVYIYNGNIGIQLADGSYNNFNSTAATKIDDGNIHHIVISVDRDQTTGLKFYQDGVLIGSQNPTGYQKSMANGAPLYVARSYDSTTNTFEGTLDELQMFSVALTDAQAKRLYESPTFTYCP